MTGKTTERRRLHRIATDKPVVIFVDGMEHHGTVLDLSLRGLLFAPRHDWQPAVGTRLLTRILLGTDDSHIELEGEVVRVDGRDVAVRCTAIDLESASRLRRMVELNLADPELLERDLAQLLAG